MEKNWVKIYTTADEIKAQMVKDVLENNGIRSVILNKKDSSYVVIGDVEIYVNRDNVLKAMTLIKSTLDA